jgi:hypothetical protein
MTTGTSDRLTLEVPCSYEYAVKRTNCLLC